SARAHHVAHARAAVASFGNDADCDVSISDHTDQAFLSLLFYDRNDSHVFALHELSGFADRRSRRNARRVLAHHVLHSHANLPVCRLPLLCAVPPSAQALCPELPWTPASPMTSRSCTTSSAGNTMPANVAVSLGILERRRANRA